MQKNDMGLQKCVLSTVFWDTTLEHMEMTISASSDAKSVQQSEFISAAKTFARGDEGWESSGIESFMKALLGQDSLGDFLDAADKDPAFIMDRLNSARSRTIPSPIANAASTHND